MPEDLYQKAVEMAREQHVPVDELLASFCAAGLEVTERLKQRAAQGDRDKFLAVMAKVPDIEPPEYDR